MLRLVLCPGILCGTDLGPRMLIPPDPCVGISQGPVVCSHILHGPDLSVPGRCWSILQSLSSCILRWLLRFDVCPGVLLG